MSRIQERGIFYAFCLKKNNGHINAPPTPIYFSRVGNNEPFFPPNLDTEMTKKRSNIMDMWGIYYAEIV